MENEESEAPLPQPEENRPSRSDTSVYPKRNWVRFLAGIEGRENLQKIKCERNVYWCLQNSPLVKVLFGAMKASGCPIDIRRHITCEPCHPKVSGGFDSQTNQVVICQNVATRRSTIQGTLVHEMIHMFDYCNNQLEFKNPDHLACTEIRAANLAHCSFLSAWIYGSASPFNFNKRHEECVKKKALTSIMATGMSEEEGKQAIERVFPRCYADLEPIGRRCRRRSEDPVKVLLEAPFYGYDYKL